MRITLDIDNLSSTNLFWSIFKQFIVMRRLPDVVRKTRKGFHVITYGLTFGTADIKEREKKMLITRLFCGGDSNRIFLDCNPKRVKQVLFTTKNVEWSDGTEVKHCSICGLPLTRYYVHSLDEEKNYCWNCFKNPYKIKVRLRRIENVLRFLGVEFNAI